MKRGSMAEAGRRLMSRDIPGLDAMRDLAGEEAPAPVEEAPAALKREARAKVEEAPEKPPKLETYGVQLFPVQWEALEAEADRRKRASGSRRRDVSAVLRDVLDRWREEGGE